MIESIRFQRLFWMFLIGAILVIRDARLSTLEGAMGVVHNLRLAHPEEFFEVELRLYNATTLHELIPSAERPVPQSVKLGEGIYTLDHKNKKYLFGSIKYRRHEDIRGLTTVVLKIYSPNNPLLNQPVQETAVEGVSDIKSYFLIHIDDAVMQTADEEAILKYKIVRATASWK